MAIIHFDMYEIGWLLGLIEDKIEEITERKEEYGATHEKMLVVAELMRKKLTEIAAANLAESREMK